MREADAWRADLCAGPDYGMTFARGAVLGSASCNEDLHPFSAPLMTDSALRRGYFSMFGSHYSISPLTPLSSLLCCTSSLRHHCGSNLRDNRIGQQSNLLSLQLSISAWLTAQYASNYPFTTERDRVHFLLFCSVWTTVLSPIFPTLLLLEFAEVLTSIAAHVVL